MCSQIGVARESCVTITANVAFESCVNGGMQIQTVPVHEAFFTLVTFEWPLAGMDTRMSQHNSFRAEHFAACVAREFVLFRV